LQLVSLVLIEEQRFGRELSGVHAARDYASSATFRVQLCALRSLAALMAHHSLDMARKHIPHIAQVCSPYLSAAQPAALQEAGRDLFRSLMRADGDVVWSLLARLSGRLAVATPAFGQATALLPTIRRSAPIEPPPASRMAIAASVAVPFADGGANADGSSGGSSGGGGSADSTQRQFDALFNPWAAAAPLNSDLPPAPYRNEFSAAAEALLAELEALPEPYLALY
jgi:hypothetical protein